MAGATFVSKVERLKYQIMKGKETSGTAESIADDVMRLPEFVSQDPARKAAIDLVLSNQLTQAVHSELNMVIDRLADQMRHKRASLNPFLMLDLPDYTEVRGYIYLTDSGEQMYVEDYRERVERRIHEMVANHPTIQAIERGEQVGDLQLIELERTLQGNLAHGDIELSPENLRRAYGLKTRDMLAFLRHVLGLENLPDYDEVVRRAFEGFIHEHNFNADQIRFLLAVQSVFLQKRRLELADLYEAPLNRFGANVVDQWFKPQEVSELLAFAESLTA